MNRSFDVAPAAYRCVSHEMGSSEMSTADNCLWVGRFVVSILFRSRESSVDVAQKQI